ncbi:DUF1801 domain-containing protein [Peristeroidobacter agariperforans]|uniref:DUF1801 domain-containing protein n=1 Tax=Peristeroidobacter agariperforans TaxID=268404 RepID=UPI00101CF5BA|nr:DUF1801 domain-containing protein [Peristeroidobacter agariperforans]
MDTVLRFSGGSKRDPAIEEWLNRTDERTALARTWFKSMRACGEDVLELMHDGCPTACVDDAPFAYVNVFKDHTNVGLFYGAHLEDPAGLLEGSGKNMRHVKLRADHPCNKTALQSLIDAAYLDLKLRLRAR